MSGVHSHVCVPQAAAWLLLFSVAGAAQEPDRYAPRDPLSLTLPRRPVTRRDYVEFLRPFAKEYEMTPQADQWGWRHGPLRLMPPLAVFALDGDRELGQRVKADLRTFARWVDQCVATKGVVYCLDAATFCTLCARELRQRGLLTADDEAWVRDLLLKLRQHHPAWAENGPWDGGFRGSQHRSQAQGINNALAAFLYPDEPGAAEWKEIAEVIWGDWWDFHDVGINDMGFEATQRREFLFIKNGFILVRDETTFHEPFRAEVGPAWNTQHVGDARGPNWINTWFSAHYFVGQKLFDVPPWDLLVWYAPRESTQLKVLPEQADKVQAESRVFPTRYSWEGEVAAGTTQQFVTVLLPHAPLRDASPLAEGITALADRPGDHRGGTERRQRPVQSPDDGQTWPVARVLEEGPAGYSVLARLSDGTIVCLYEADIVTGMCDDRYLRLARFNLAWLTGKDVVPKPVSPK